MNILQILPELNVGGVETGTLDLAQELIRRGHKAIVVSNGGELVKDLLSFGAIHYQLPVHKKSPLAVFKIIPKLIQIIEKEEIDIVHARSRVPAWAAYFACRRSRRVFITTCHGYYKKHPLSFVMGWAKRVIAISNVIARHMIDDFGVPFERIKLIPRSVNLEKFKFINRAQKRGGVFNVGIIGRISPIKGHMYFIKSMAKVARVIPNLKVWIVGDAPVSKEAYKERLKILTKRLGLWQSTEFLGAQKDIPAILGNLDLLVLATTTQEAFGRVIIEAQAAGVPVVATSVGGVVDIIEEDKNGLLIPPADPQAMSEAAIRIYREPEFASLLVENAYKKVKEKYNIGRMVDDTVEVYHDALASLKILIIKFSSVGDVILSAAAIRSIREKFPHPNKITFLVGEESKEVVLRCPYIDELLVCNFKDNYKGVGGFLRLAAKLRKKNFDLVIDLQNNRRSHILSWLTLSPDRFGYDNKKFGFLLNHRLKNLKNSVDPITHQFRVLKALGIQLKDPHLELWPGKEDSRYIDEFLNSHWVSVNQKIIGINISASERWLTKLWPLKHISKLCDDLSGRGVRVIITGTEKDLKRATEIIDSVKNTPPINACGKTTINQLGCLIKKCSVYVSSDSAPLHIACAFNTPFVALFGPTDYRRHLPLANRYIVLKKELGCVPCYQSKCKTVKCMEAITPQEVLEAIDKLMA